MAMRGTLTTRLGAITEPFIEWVIRLCGWSAIFFVFAIFFFVFREGASFLLGKLDLWEFFTSINWRPDSRIRPPRKFTFRLGTRHCNFHGRYRPACVRIWRLHEPRAIAW